MSRKRKVVFDLLQLARVNLVLLQDRESSIQHALFLGLYHASNEPK
jgi:hypothetical protein